MTTYFWQRGHVFHDCLDTLLHVVVGIIQFTILNKQTEISDKFVSMIVTKILWYQNKCRRLNEKSCILDSLKTLNSRLGIA